MMELVLLILGLGIGFGVAQFFLKQKSKAWEQERNALQDEIRIIRERAIRLEAEKEASQKQIEQGKDDLKKMEEMLIGKFENLSNRIFEEKSEKFKKQSQESLGELLNPLRERLSEFQQKVNEQVKEQFSLKEQIKNIVEVSGKMSQQTENLTKALKGDSKVQGDWGEVILEKILEESGLRKGMNYSVQGGGLNLRDGDGRLQKPDVIVNLPEGKHVIIDSKVSLTHYERFFSAEDEAAQSLHLKQYIDSVRKHADDLGARRYHDAEGLGTPDFVLMFVPIEAAYVLAVQKDPGLHSYAWDKKVVIVCPTTIFATLKTVASVWRLELQNRNALEIARQGGDLYDKIAGFVEDMEKMGKQIKAVEGSYDSAMKKLSSGKANILSRTEKLRMLGVKTSKSLPADLVDFEGEEQETPIATGHNHQAA